MHDHASGWASGSRAQQLRYADRFFGGGRGWVSTALAWVPNSVKACVLRDDNSNEMPVCDLSVVRSSLMSCATPTPMQMVACCGTAYACVPYVSIDSVAVNEGDDAVLTVSVGGIYIGDHGWWRNSRLEHRRRHGRGARRLRRGFWHHHPNRRPDHRHDHCPDHCQQ